MNRVYTYTKKEEVVNAITHGIGAGLSIAALVLMVSNTVVNGATGRLAIVLIYGISMLMLFTFSTLCHAFPEGKAKLVMELLDHTSIYLFIAGTYTPYAVIAIGGKTGYTLLALVWGLAILGIIFKAFFLRKFMIMSTLIYIIMGWMIVVAWEPLSHAVPPMGLQMLIYGGLLYTLGSIFYVWIGFPYHHAVWHLMVLVASILHFLSIFLYILPLS